MKSTDAILKILYPRVEQALSKNTNKFKQAVGKFINARNESMFDTCPCDRIYYGENDAMEMYEAVGMNKAQVTEAIQLTYYYPISAFNPRAAKDEITVLLLTIIRYFVKKNDDKNAELAMMYLAFSGKFYPSIHYMSFPKVQPSEYRHVMEYVVNKMLSDKFYLKTQGSVFGAIKAYGTTWLDSYERMIKDYDDEDVVYLIQQLHNRIKTFMKNIASLYYEAYENKDYITYDGDSLVEDDYHLADNDSMRAERCIEKAMEKINTSNVDYATCKMASDNNVKTEEVKSIIESILNQKDNILEVKELVRLLVYTYYASNLEGKKDISNINFVSFSIAPKPNAKEPHILRIKEIVEGWLEDNSVNYRKRKRRLATANSYNRAILLYFTLVIHNANR